MIFTPQQYNWGDQIKEGKMDGASSTHGRDMHTE
jgi:hypothetical protein